MVKIFLDDVREPKNCVGYMHTRIGTKNPIYLEDWVVVRNYQQFLNTLDEHFPYISHVSFDHDLADGHYTVDLTKEAWEEYSNYGKEMTGYDCALALLDYYKKENKRDLPEIFVHSMNPVGRERIENLFK